MDLDGLSSVPTPIRLTIQFADAQTGMDQKAGATGSSAVTAAAAAATATAAATETVKSETAEQVPNTCLIHPQHAQTRF